MSVTLVTGPVRSGKSRHAEQLLADQAVVTYLATGRRADDGDPEWAERVHSHRRRRPEAWGVVETVDVEPVLRSADAPVLLDCLGTWLTGVVDEAGWDDLDAARAALRERVAGLLGALRAAPVHVVVVTNEVGWSLVPTTASGRLFQDELGRLNAAVSGLANRVHLVVAGRVLDLTAAPLVPDHLPPRTLDA
ncbi:adenosylcobinamide kinase /adenosylcobinamide-phosphate guanylyltransferase [Terracoccus luteus]|uniref:Adenosylcobinamide kinase n=1 Tax=Terracoccus luteus TaxID=53356 RepID=A0A495XU95_9MICO|nr:bifunctional adenosylcobinamide kinase/adenosylcobinamide-phosphate guanylyltransferase [Terracoccus luteus]RKT77767.1 adenosylcobinamide kinase /adenosylcobinamide-phosphate guanylyltransferase [Terracoccus luteus]